MKSTRNDDLQRLILDLLKTKHKINVKEIITAAGIVYENSSARRAIQRLLRHLIDKEMIQASGNARARVYFLKQNLASEVDTPSRVDDTGNIILKEIFHSKESLELLEYGSRAIQERTPVAYNQDFLRSYEPNRTYYLNFSFQQTLLAAGNVESIERAAGTYARNILSRLLIDLSWNSSRLEGNTYTLLETKRLIELGENATGKNAIEAQMILNHKDAIEYIIESADEKNISGHDIKSIHALLSENLLGDASASGRIRDITVGISGTTYLPLDNPHVLRECFDIFVEKLNCIENPFEQSFFALVHLSYLQAFEDVNKRTARLVANIPLIKRNLKPLSFIDVRQEDYVRCLLAIYEKNNVTLLRDLYVWAYHRSASRYSALQQTMGEPNLFKLKNRSIIQSIVRTIILDNIHGNQVVLTIKNLINQQSLSEPDAENLLQIIETEIMSLHEDNIARFKIRPSEFKEWKGID